MVPGRLWRVIRPDFTIHYDVLQDCGAYSTVECTVSCPYRGMISLEKQEEHSKWQHQKIITQSWIGYTLNEGMNEIVVQLAAAYEMLPCSVHIDLFRP